MLMVHYRWHHLLCNSYVCSMLCREPLHPLENASTLCATGELWQATRLLTRIDVREERELVQNHRRETDITECKGGRRRRRRGLRLRRCRCRCCCCRGDWLVYEICHDCFPHCISVITRLCSRLKNERTQTVKDRFPSVNLNAHEAWNTMGKVAICARVDYAVCVGRCPG